MNRFATVLVAIFTGSALSHCGPESSSTRHPFFDTIEYINDNGLPALSDLIPSLPSQFSFVSGTDTDESGLPALPSSLEKSGLSGTTKNFNALLTDAQSLAAQGFSESRRIEALVHNLVGPVYGMLDNRSLFKTPSGDESESDTGQATGLDEFGLQGTGTNVLNSLVSNLNFAVDLESIEGMPTKLLFKADTGEESISITGLWQAEGTSYNAGFRADVRMPSIDDFEVTFSLAPNRLGGLVSEWSTSSCEDDIWQITIANSVEAGKSARISSLECPSQRNSVSSVSFSKVDDSMVINGGFAQSFDDSEDSLRGWLGARQGFVMQAATDVTYSNVAAAAAVISEDDFDAPSQDTIDSFGVGRLISRYLQQKYWQPTLEKADDGIFGNLDNVAYWMCIAPVVSDAVKSAVSDSKTLCKGKEIDPSGLLSSLTTLNKNIKSNSLVPSDIKKTVSTIVNVLTIRNTIFIDDEGTLAYEDAPNDVAGSLNEVRSASGVEAVESLTWKESVENMLLPLTAAEVPDSIFDSIAGSLGGYLSDACNSLVTDSSSKAKKDSDNASSLCKF